MALPSIMRKLFRNDGYGPLLKDEIIDRHISIQDWSSTHDYPVYTLVRGSDGLPYWSVAQSGPSTAGAKDPTADDGSYWVYISTQQWVLDNIAPNTLYLDAVNGSDSNGGLTESDPLQTFAAAQAKLTGLKSYANNSNYVRLVLLPGNYGNVIYEGNQCPPLWFDFRAGASVSQLRVTGSTQVQVTGNATFNSNDSYAWQLYAGSNTYLFVPDDTTLTFKGKCRACLIARRQGIILLENCSLIFSGVTVSDAVARVQDMALLYCYNVTTSGTATGKRYNATNISEISTDGGGANFFPGTVAGTASSTSLYL